MNEENLVFLIWNVRGLNDDDRRTPVSSTISSSSANIACLKESKPLNMDAATATFVGDFRLRGFAQRPTSGPHVPTVAS
jgi:hypothetical protein